MNNFLDNLLQIKKFMPLNDEDQQSLKQIEKQCINKIRHDIKKCGTSDLFLLQSQDGNFLSHVSVILNLNNLAIEILKHEEIANKKNKNNETMAFTAIKYKNYYIANKCLNCPSIVTTLCNNTYFFFLATKHAESVQFLNNLIDNYPQYLKLKDCYNEPLTFYLVRNKKTKQAIKIIKQYPEIAKIKNIDGDTMGHIAFDEQNLAVLNAWIENKNLRRIQNKYKQSVVHLLAIENKKSKLLEQIIKDLVALKQQDYLGNTPVHYFCENSNIKLAHAGFKIKDIHCQLNNKGNSVTDIAREKNDLIAIANYDEHEK